MMRHQYHPETTTTTTMVQTRVVLKLATTWIDLSYHGSIKHLLTAVCCLAEYTAEHVSAGKHPNQGFFFFPFLFFSFLVLFPLSFSFLFGGKDETGW